MTKNDEMPDVIWVESAQKNGDYGYFQAWKRKTRKNAKHPPIKYTRADHIAEDNKKVSDQPTNADCDEALERVSIFLDNLYTDVIFGMEGISIDWTKVCLEEDIRKDMEIIRKCLHVPKTCKETAENVTDIKDITSKIMSLVEDNCHDTDYLYTSIGGLLGKITSAFKNMSCPECEFKRYRQKSNDKRAAVGEFKEDAKDFMFEAIARGVKDEQLRVEMLCEYFAAHYNVTKRNADTED